MNITMQTVNFTELVKNTNPDSTFRFQSRMVSELRNNFSTEQQQWFIANLYMYLNYHQTDDYPISLADVWKMIGFSTIGNAKKKLMNNFTEREDYKVFIIQMDKKSKGRPDEKVMLNVDTFKSMCLMSNTKESKEIRKYYIKLENVYNKVLKEDYEEYQKTLELKDNEIKVIKDSVDYEKRLEKHNVLVEILRDKKCIYLKQVKSKNNLNLIKIGSSGDILQRNGSLQKTFGCDELFLDIFECDYVFREVESNILNDQTVKRYKYTSKLDTGHVSNEVVILSEDFTYSELVGIVKKHIEQTDSLSPRELLENQKLNLFEKVLEKGEVENLLKYMNGGYSKELFIPQEEQQENTGVFKVKNFGQQIQQIDPNNLSKVIKVYQDMETLLTNDTHSLLSETGIRSAIKENRVYKQFRWMFVTDDQDPQVVKDIAPTMVTKCGGVRVIYKLNESKTKILGYYKSLCVLAEDLQISVNRVRNIIRKQKHYICDDQKVYFVYKDSCPEHLYMNYKVVEYIPKGSIKVKTICPKTNTEVVYPSLKHAYNELKIHHKTVHKVIKEQRLSHGYYWDYVK